MPFKTKRQKIAAEQRRYIFSDGKVSLNEGEKKGGSRVEKSSLKTVDDSFSGDLTAGRIPGDWFLLKRDIVKILALSILIIFTQVTLRLTLF